MKEGATSFDDTTRNGMGGGGGGGLGVLRHFHQYFTYIAADSSIDGGNRGTRRK